MLTEKQLDRELESIINHVSFIEKLRLIRLDKDSLNFKDIQKAYKLAKELYGNDKRETGELTITHLEKTTFIAAYFGKEYFNTNVAIASILHDIKEDKKKIKREITPKEIKDRFGGYAYYLIDAMTKKNYYPEQQRRIKSLKRIINDNHPPLFLIKMSDAYHNMMTIYVHGIKKQIQKSIENIGYLTFYGRYYFPELADLLEERCKNIIKRVESNEPFLN